MESKGNNQKSLQGYPSYPPGDDIYLHFQEEEDIDPENISGTKESDNFNGVLNEKDFPEDVSGGDLDIPGADSDDMHLTPEIEDEENSYYSLGGDDHNDLDENQGLYDLDDYSGNS
jgi:hypothetical protein